jgi:hypothetical protein
MTRSGRPPVEYLRQCSSTSLRYFEMNKLEHAANLRRELVVLLDEMMEETALALLARWMLERRSGRGGAALHPGEARGCGSPADRDLLAGWLASTRQVESGTSLPANNGNGKTRASVTESIPANGNGGETREPRPPQPREGEATARGSARSSRRGERNGARAVRTPARAAAQPQSPSEPEGFS